jgi:hypothetical protein
MLAVEVKTGSGRLSDEQRAVLTLLSQIPCFRTCLAHEADDWKEFVRWLRRPAPAPPALGYVPMEGDPATFLARASKRDRARTTARVPWPKW